MLSFSHTSRREKSGGQSQPQTPATQAFLSASHTFARSTEVTCPGPASPVPKSRRQPQPSDARSAPSHPGIRSAAAYPFFPAALAFFAAAGVVLPAAFFTVPFFAGRGWAAPFFAAAAGFCAGFCAGALGLGFAAAEGLRNFKASRASGNPRLARPWGIEGGRWHDCKIAR